MKTEAASLQLLEKPLLLENVEQSEFRTASSSEKRALKRLGRLLATLEITFEDLKEHGIDVVSLARILELSWFAKLKRWLVYDETILKLMLLPILRTHAIHAMSRGSVMVKNGDLELEAIGTRETERIQRETGAGSAANAPSLSTKKHSFFNWLNSFFYPESNSFLFSRIGALRQVFFTTGVVEGIETITMKVWSVLLLSFMGVDLFYYITDDYFRKLYSNSLVNVFFKGNDVGLSSALTMPRCGNQKFSNDESLDDWFINHRYVIDVLFSLLSSQSFYRKIV